MLCVASNWGYGCFNTGSDIGYAAEDAYGCEDERGVLAPRTLPIYTPLEFNGAKTEQTEFAVIAIAVPLAAGVTAILATAAAAGPTAAVFTPGSRTKPSPPGV